VLVLHDDGLSFSHVCCAHRMNPAAAGASVLLPDDVFAQPQQTARLPFKQHEADTAIATWVEQNHALSDDRRKVLVALIQIGIDANGVQRYELADLDIDELVRKLNTLWVTPEQVMAYGKQIGVWKQEYAEHFPKLTDSMMTDVIVFCSVMYMLHAVGVIAMTDPVATRSLLGFNEMKVLNLEAWWFFLKVAVDPTSSRSMTKMYIFNSLQKMYDLLKMITGWKNVTQGKTNGLVTPQLPSGRVNVAKDKAMMGEAFIFDETILINGFPRWLFNRMGNAKILKAIEARLARKRKQDEREAQALEKEAQVAAAAGAPPPATDATGAAPLSLATRAAPTTPQKKCNTLPRVATPPTVFKPESFLTCPMGYEDAGSLPRKTGRVQG
jgi:hypothetical protein